MKVAFVKEKRMFPETKEYLDNVVKIVNEYGQKGYRMTLRQLYYQLVSRGIIPNEKAQYSKLSRVLNDARMTGIVDWDFIEDRIRRPDIPNEFENMSESLKQVQRYFRLQRWSTQENYVEVWVEKDALSGILAPITDAYHVTLLVNKGFSSVSAIYESSIRFLRAEKQGKKCHLIYLGDFDPSGDEMEKDIDGRLFTMWSDVRVHKMALTMDQIEQYEPPPNPVKKKDSRTEGYLAKYGERLERYKRQHGLPSAEVSWELDALPPDVLIQVVRDKLDELINKQEYNKIIGQEKIVKQQLAKVIKTVFKNGKKKQDPNLKACEQCKGLFLPFTCERVGCGVYCDLMCRFCHRFSTHFHNDQIERMVADFIRKKQKKKAKKIKDIQERYGLSAAEAKKFDTDDSNTDDDDSEGEDENV